MKLRAALTINGRRYPKGAEVPWYMIYPFFLVHMLMFGASGFFLAYGNGDDDVLVLFLHGGIATLVYLIFYLVIFGLDEVKWMFINAALGVYGIYCEMSWLLSLFGKQFSDYAWYVHVIPTLYFVLYTFLVRQLILDLTRSRENKDERRKVEFGYVALSVAIYSLSLWFAIN
jgi:hypothetical protein